MTTMTAEQTPAGYSRLQIALHWGIAALIGCNYLFSEGMPEIFDATMEGTPDTGWTATIHVVVGLTVLAFVAVRLIVRLTRGVPKPTDGAPTAMATAAYVSHMVQYALLVAVPVLGAITWFGGIDATADWHVYAVNTLMVVVLIHAAAALFHHFVLKDGTLMRMLRAR